jgi:HSP20 family protein
MSMSNPIPFKNAPIRPPDELIWLARQAGERSLAEHEEGQLSVDVSETPEELVIVATMAGTKPEDIELHLHNDFLTIRGRRLSPVPKASQYFTTECYWGTFSRTIVLPVDVKADMGRSEYRNGVLAIYLPKAIVTSSIPIIVIED